MLFNSFEFLLFFPVVTAIYFLLPHKFRWFYLLASSCFFYMAFIPVYILILFLTIIVDYIAGILIEDADGARRKWFLVMSIVANVGVLAFFKYYNFFAANADQLFYWAHAKAYVPLLNIILPIGLSFHTFQAMSYTIEVYRGNQKAERHFGIYSLYVMFYPQLVAGPIERPQNLLHQFHEKKSFNYYNAVSGLRQIMWGMFKKVVIADKLLMVTDTVFNDPLHHYSGIAFFMSAIFFAFQVYCDFSGYSDIALGTARVMGFDLMVNFNRPFSAKSISELWRRWHISLSTWLSDYLYNPIVISLRNRGKGAVVFALLFTFFICGFWHGAGWKFIIFGLLQGIAIVYEFFTRKARKKLFSKLPKWLNNGLSKFLAFNYFAFTCIFFRANNIKSALLMAGKLRSIPSEIVQVFLRRKMAFLQLPAVYLILEGIGLIIFLELAQGLSAKYNLENMFNKKPLFFRWAIYYAGIIAIFYLGVFEKHDFIYFQF